VSKTITRTQLYEDALQSMEPMWELRGIVRALLAEGVDRDQLQEELTQFALDLRAAGRERDEDIVTEVLDFLVGFSSSFMKL
jgi:hypothetical protein